MKNLLSSSYSLFLMLHEVLKLAKVAFLCYNDAAAANQKYIYGLLVNQKKQKLPFGKNQKIFVSKSITIFQHKFVAHHCPSTVHISQR